MKNPERHSSIGFFLLIFVVGFIAWASLFQIDETVRAQGQVIAQTRTQIVQVADGGVLEKLFVQEGDSVAKGQQLARLETERARAGVNEVEAKLASLRVAKTRARAEADGITPNFSEFQANLPDSVSAQWNLYVENLNAFRQETASVKAALEIVQLELDTVGLLADNGDASQMEFMRTRREVIDLEGKLSTINSKYVVDARREIAKIEHEMSSLRFQLKEQQSLLEHTNIMSPVDGVITDLALNTLGGVLRGGDELMRIAPTGGTRLIQLRIPPVDIGNLQLGLPVSVRLDAFDYTIYGNLDGRLDYISADTLTDKDEDGRVSTYYRANIILSKVQPNDRLNVEQVLKPGITATVDIRTGNRSVLTFLAKPILRAFSGAMTEQ